MTIIFFTLSSAVKPIAPEIISFMRQENGNYDVMWKSKYEMKSLLLKHLKYQVCYKKKGEEDKVVQLKLLLPSADPQMPQLKIQLLLLFLKNIPHYCNSTSKDTLLYVVS